MIIVDDAPTSSPRAVTSTQHEQPLKHFFPPYLATIAQWYPYYHFT